MKQDELIRLLKQRESETLEFKSEWYKIDDPKQQIRERQRGEMVKDFLMLLNGNTNSVGKVAYLIIGASDRPNAAGNRELFDTKPVDAKEVDAIQQIVNGYIEPRMESLQCETVKVPDPSDPANYKSLQVWSIGPSRYLHETIKRVQAEGKVSDYNEYTVLIRHNGNVKIASMLERETLKKLKQIWYDNSKKVSPIWAGIIIGGFVGGAIGYQPAQNVDPVIRAVAASFVCALLGLGMGLAYNNVSGFKDFLYRLPPQWRLPTLILGVVLSVGIGYALYQVYPFRTPVK